MHKNPQLLSFFKIKTLSILCLFFLLNQLKSDPGLITQKFMEKLCQNVEIEDRSLDKANIDYLRYKRSTGIQNRMESKFQFYKLFSEMKPITFALSIVIPYALLSIAAIISGIYFWLFFRSGRSIKKKDRFFRILKYSSFIVPFELVIYLTTYIILVSIVDRYQEKSLCQAAKIGNMLVNGYYNTQNGNQYIGLQTMINSIVALTSEFMYLNNQSNNVQDILQQNLPDASLNALNQLKTISNDFKSSVTANQFGRPTTSSAFLSMGTYFSDISQVEFTNIYDISRSFNDMAKGVMNLGDLNNPSTIANNMNTIESLISFLTLLIGEFRNTIFSLLYPAIGLIKMVRMSYFILIAVKLIFLFLAGIITYQIKRGVKMNNIIQNKRLTIIVLVIMAVVLGLTGLFEIIKMTAISNVTSFCIILGSVNNQDSRIYSMVSQNLNERTRLALKECAFGQNGNLFDLYYTWSNSTRTTSVDDVYNLIVGIVDYKAFSSTRSSIMSDTLELLIANYTLITKGIVEGTPGLNDQVLYLNTLLEESNGMASLTIESCTSNKTTCFGIDLIDTIPGTLSNKNMNLVQVIFRNLKAYIMSEQAVLGSLIGALINASGNPLSPMEAYKNVKQSLIQMSPNLDSILQVLPNTVKTFQNFTGRANQLFDCRNIQLELRILEDHVCFNFYYFFYILMNFGGATFFVYLFIIWLYFFTLAQMEFKLNKSNSIIPILDFNKKDGGEENPVFGEGKSSKLIDMLA